MPTHALGSTAGVSGAMPHTNNGAEAYHSHLNAEFYVKHPNIYMFVDVLKKVQQTAYVVMNSAVELLYSFAIVFSRGFVCLLFLNRCAFVDFVHAFL